MSNHQPIIDSNPNEPGRDWRKDRVLAARPFFVAGVAFLLVLLALGLACFKSCTDLGRAAKGDIYVYNGDNDGFVGCADMLLAELLADTVPGIDPTDLASLHCKYPALEFELPRSEAAKCVVEAADLRLVGIHPDRIKTESLRHFYHNSRLPQLLRQQHENLGEPLFNIVLRRLPRSAKTDYAVPFAIASITLSKAVAQVHLSKTLWDGHIYANNGALFTDDKYIYITFGNSAVPLPIGSQFGNRASGNALIADSKTMHITNQDGSPLDYYQHYLNTSASSAAQPSSKATAKGKKDEAVGTLGRSTQVRFELADRRGHLHKGFSVDCKGDSLRFTMQTGVELHVYAPSTLESRTATAHVLRGEGKHIVLHHDGMKIAVYEGQEKRKFGEFTINHTDPTRILSRIVQTQTGSSRYTIGEEMTDLFTQQMISNLARLMTTCRTHDDIAITLDPLLSREFERETKEYLHQIQHTLKRPARQTHELYDISLTVMDMATGDILAMPFYTTDFDASPDKDGATLPADEAHRLTTRNVALARRYLGSTFKPLVALAATESNDRLFNLVIDRQTSIVSEQPYEVDFFGRRSRGWAKSTPGMWSKSCDFTQFLSSSDDVYPVALAAIAMTGTPYDGMRGDIPAKGWMDEKTHKGANWLTMKAFDEENAATSPFTDWMAHITGASLYSETPDTALLRHLPLTKGTSAIQRALAMSNVCPDPTNLHTEMFVGGDFRGTLVPWVLGQGSNEWSTVQIATAWARMLTGHAVLPSYIKSTQPEDVSSLFADTYTCGSNLADQQPLSENRRRQIWSTFLSCFRDAQKGGTLAPMNSQVASLNASLNLSGGRDLVVFAKTGTPDAYVRYDMPIMGGNSRYFDVGLFTFGLMRESELQAARTGRLSHGIVGVVRITRTYQCSECDKARRKGSRTQCSECRKANGLSSSHARSFFAESPARLRKFYDMTRRYL